MKAGKVVSFSSEKKYGFIKSSDGESYFFHLNDVANENHTDIHRGANVRFDDLPTPKGMAAKNVKAERTYPIYSSPGDEIIVSKSRACGRNNEAVLSIGTVTVEDKDPNEAVEVLKRKARSAGCNAVLNLKRDKRTGSSWVNGNYKYTIHLFTADLALVKTINSTSDASDAELNRKEMDEEIKAIEQKGRPTGQQINDASAMGAVLGTVVFFIFLIFLSGLG